MKKYLIFSCLYLIFNVSYAQNSLPGVTIRNISGQEISFKEAVNIKDTAVIVSFWATWCLPCIKELETISQQYQKRQNVMPFKMMAISIDDARTASRVKPFVAGKSWPFDVYLDENNDLKRALNINDVPHNMVIKNGQVVYEHNGYIPGNEELLFSHLKDSKNNSQEGRLSGSFETYSQIYQNDKKISAIVPQDKVGSNNYLKLDYTYKQFTAGVQFEGYLPTIVGFPFQTNASKLINKYFKYTANKFSVQVGDFYEQFGSGLVFRAWENRQIGINNALEGVNIHVQPAAFLKIKALYGKPRNVLDYANANIRGTDAEIDVLQLLNNSDNSKTKVLLGGSYVSRFQTYTGPDANFPATVNNTAIRLSINNNSTSFYTEYVHKSKDPHDVNFYNFGTGKAFLLNGSFSKEGLGLNLTYRAMQNMDFRGTREAFGVQLPVNYIPSLSKQHDYLTTNIYVYNPQAWSETGGQAELFYNFKEGTYLGGKFGSKISVSYSQFRNLKDLDNLFSIGKEKYFEDLSIEWKKKWNEKWSAVFSYHNIYYNKGVIIGGGNDIVTSNIFVLNTTHQYSEKNAVRFELQHLSTADDLGNWASALSEFSFAPKWSFYVSDLYNYGKTDIHYITLGSTFTKGANRLNISYGRQREGLFCVGGVCRFVPASSGFTIALISNFNN